MAPRLISASSPFSRRVALTRLGAGGVGMALAMRSLAAAAQEATPPMVADLPPAVEELIGGWETLDAERIADAFAEDAIFEDVGAGAVREGREALHAYLTEVIAAFDDLTFQVITGFATEGWAATEWTFSGRYTGMVPGFPPGEGQMIAFRGAHILELADGQIQHAREYYDLYGLLIQLGVIPAPAEVATPPA